MTWRSRSLLSKGIVVGGDGRGCRGDVPVARATFDIRTRAVLGPPAGQAVKSYPVRVTRRRH